MLYLVLYIVTSTQWINSSTKFSLKGLEARNNFSACYSELGVIDEEHVTADHVETQSKVDTVEETLTVSTVTFPPSHEAFEESSSRINKIDQKMGTGAYRIAVSPDGSLFAVGCFDGKLLLFEAKTEWHSSSSNFSRSISRDESQRNPNESKPTRMRQITFDRPKSHVTAIVFSKVADKLVLLVTWRNGVIIAFDIENEEKLNRCHTPLGLRDCALSNDGQQVILGGTHVRKMFENGMILAVGCPRKVSLDNVTSGDCCKTFRFAEDVARSIKFSNTGDRIRYSINYSIH